MVGEGEATFFQLLKGIQERTGYESIPGVAFKKGERIIYTPRDFTEELDRLAYPAFDLIDVKEYLNNAYLYQSRSVISKDSISVITSRGCPYQCIFCSARFTMGRKFRPHSAAYVVQHIKYLVETYGIRKFHFEDGNATLDRERYEQILDGIIGHQLEIKWDIPDGIRADTLDEKLLRKMKTAGCVDVTIGIESGNTRVLNEIIKKNTSLEKVMTIAKTCAALELQLNAFYVIGFPGETLEEIGETIDLALDLYGKYQVIPYLFLATPLYGTELYEICRNNGFIMEEPTDEQLSTGTFLFGDPIISTADFSKNDLRKMVLYFILQLRKLGPPSYIREFYEKPKSDFRKKAVR